MVQTEPLPKALKEEIMKLHPELTEEDFQEYLRLVDEADFTDPIESPERSKRAQELLSEFVRTHLPRLEEAHSNYNKKLEEQYIEKLSSELPSPVDIAIADTEVAEWIRERTRREGQYDVNCKRVRDPDVYIVEFRFRDDSVLKVQVEQTKNTVHSIFRRTVKKTGVQ